MRKSNEKRKQYQRDFSRKYYKNNRTSCLQKLHETYIYFKELKICTCCHSEPAKKTSTLCLNCSDKRSVENMEYRNKLKKSPDNKQNVKLRNKKRYEKINALGYCYVCGKRQPPEGKKICYECSIKRKRQYLKRREGIIPRNARHSFGECFYCGEPVKKGFRTCPKHYDICVSNIKSKTSQYSNHPWKNNG